MGMTQSLEPGYYAILSTPFTETEAIDWDSLDRLVDFYISQGAVGLVALGVMGEESRLDDAERLGVVTRVIRAARDRVPVVAGVTSPAVTLTLRRVGAYAEAGARAVMVAPVPGMTPDAVVALYEAVGTLGVPIVLQDHPASSGVTLPIGVLKTIVDRVPMVVAVKNEAPPTGLKTARLCEALTRPVSILGGLGGLSLLDELDAGSHGAMTGFAFPEVLVAMWRRYHAGDRLGARDLYHRYLPWLLYEAMPGYSVAIRKAFLHGRGIIAHPTVRQPGPALEPALTPRIVELLDLWEPPTDPDGSPTA
jgi:4-hydroxy-tetrahydrodipicolinate synthase